MMKQIKKVNDSMLIFSGKSADRALACPWWLTVIVETKKLFINIQFA
jgi:hypothetical protein